MLIDQIRSEQSGSSELLNARVRRGQDSAPLWFRWRGERCERAGDALLLAMLQPAMATGEKVEVEAAVSSELLGGLDVLQSVLIQSQPELRHIAVRAADVVRDREAKTGDAPTITAIWFDGSIASFYTYLQCRDEVEAILFPVDFIDDREVAFREGRGIKAARHRAAELGKPLVPFETNLRDVARSFGATLWDAVWYGAAAHLLSGSVQRIVLPSSGVNGSDVRTFVGASGVGGVLGFVAPGEHADDAEMHRALASDWVTLEALRVCWENPFRSYNCGRCSKCTRSVPGRRLVELLGRETRSRRKQAEDPVNIKTEERSHGAFEVARDR